MTDWAEVGGGNIELVRKAFEAFAARDADTLSTLVHPEVEFFPMTRALAGRREPYRGRGGIREYLRDVAIFWQELEVIPRRMSDGGGHVVVHGRVRGRTGGTVIDSPADWIWKISDGLIAWGCVYAKRDAETAFRAAGVPVASG